MIAIERDCDVFPLPRAAHIDHQGLRLLQELGCLDALLPRMISLRENFSVYDAVYVALAESIGATFVTADDKLATAVRAHTKVRLGAYPSRST